MVARKPIFRKILSIKGNGMTSQKEKYKEATSFFGVERMAKLESAMKEQNAKTKKNKFNQTVMNRLKIFGVFILFGYSAVVTIYMAKNSNNDLEQPASAISQNTPEPIISTTLERGKETNAIAKLKVKRGDNLIGITQRIIKSNGVKNTTENRKVIMDELKSKNNITQVNQTIKCGWTLVSLTKAETQQICKN